jgi:hypothetical protein
VAEHARRDGGRDRDDGGPESPAESFAATGRAIIKRFDLPIGKSGEADAQLASLTADQRFCFAEGHSREVVDVFLAVLAKAGLSGTAHLVPVSGAGGLYFDQIEWTANAHGGSRTNTIGRYFDECCATEVPVIF